jgi:hypothetical protein
MKGMMDKWFGLRKEEREEREEKDVYEVHSESR